MIITIRPTEPSDSTAISKVHYAALSTYHPFYAAFFEIHPQETLPVSTSVALKDPENRFVVAVDGEDVVGFVRFRVIREVETKEEQEKEDDVAGTEIKNLFKPKEHMKDLWEEFNSADDEKDKVSKDFESQPHIYIKHLMVLPTYQYRGIGAALLKTVLEESDAAGLPTILISSAEGVKLYRRLGFEEKITWRIDNGAWSEKIAKRFSEVGVEDVDGLVERYRGVDEVEMYMVRSPAL